MKLDRLMQLAPFAVVLASMLTAVGAYLYALDYPFISDDKDYLIDNNALIELKFSELANLIIEPYNPFEFLPLRDFSYWLILSLFGLSPSAFRAYNIAYYLLCLLLVFASTSNLWRYFRPAEASNTPWFAAITTTLFALHPAHVEAVVWVSGHKDVLSGTFALLAIWLATNAKREHTLSPSYAVATIAALLAAMLSKATTVAIAPIISILWLIFWRDTEASQQHKLTLLWPLAPILLGAGILSLFIKHSPIASTAYYGAEMVSRTFAILGWLARLTVTPENRQFSYPLFDDATLPFVISLGVTVVILAISGSVLALRKRSIEGFALTSFLLLCTPYLQLIPYATFSPVSDRFLYIAVWPLILLFVSLAWRLTLFPRTILLLFIILPFSFQTIQRPRDWRSFEALIDADLRTYPEYYLPAFQKIGSTQFQYGTYAELTKTANNIKQTEIRNIVIGLINAGFSIRVASQKTGNPAEALVRLHNLGTALKHPPTNILWDPSLKYVWDESNRWLRYEWDDLTKSFPYDAEVRYHAGIHMLNSRHYEDAVTHFRIAIQSRNLPEPLLGTAFTSLGHALLKSGHTAEAETTLRTALARQQPDTQAYCLLAELYKQGNRADDAGQFESHCPEAAQKK